MTSEPTTAAGRELLQAEYGTLIRREGGIETAPGFIFQEHDTMLLRILAIEAEARANAEAQVAELRAAGERLVTNCWEPWDDGAACDAAVSDFRRLLAAAPASSRPILANERHAAEAILDRVNADPDDDAAIVARALLRGATPVSSRFLDLDAPETVERLADVLRMAGHELPSGGEMAFTGGAAAVARRVLHALKEDRREPGDAA